MKEKINILSLFDGMSTLQLAMKNQGVTVGKYYASEIKPYAIKLTQHHFPDTIQLGDIRNWKDWDIDWWSIDFVGSGSPCQDLSIAGKRKGLSGERSSLFFVFVDILNYIRKFNPDVKFLQENVASAPKKDVGIMSRALGVYPQLIDSRMYVPQSRKRLYWSNIRTKKTGLFGDIQTNIRLDKGNYPVLQDVLTSGKANHKVAYALLERYYDGNNYANNPDKNEILKKRSKMFRFTTITEVKQINKSKESNGRQPYQQNRIYDSSGIHPALNTYNNGKIKDNEIVRLLNRTEMERIQGFPDNYTEVVSVSQAASLLGDAWTLPVIEQFIKEYKRTLHAVSCA